VKRSLVKDFSGIHRFHTNYFKSLNIQTQLEISDGYM